MTPPHAGTAALTGPRTKLPAPQLDTLAEVTSALAATAPDYDRSGDFPAEGIAAVYAAGLLTASVATDLGGPGL
ncbi:MAG TPA: hypothetical protein VNP03_02100, partial [Pseudonocardia sp.]|nr:hypothetical protein [Pseudonocardia sp.]